MEPAIYKEISHTLYNGAIEQPCQPSKADSYLHFSFEGTMSLRLRDLSQDTKVVCDEERN